MCIAHTVATHQFNVPNAQHPILGNMPGILIDSYEFAIVGGVGSVVERRSLAGDFPCPAPDLQLTGDHLRG